VRRDRYSTTQLCDDLEQEDGPVCSPLQRIADSDIAGAPSDVRGINAAAHLGNPPASGRVLDMAQPEKASRGACELQMNRGNVRSG